MTGLCWALFPVSSLLLVATAEFIFERLSDLVWTTSVHATDTYNSRIVSVAFKYFFTSWQKWRPIHDKTCGTYMCPLHVPVSTSLAPLLPPSSLCFMHPVTPHQATISLDTQTFVPSLSTPWPVLWTVLSKLYFSGRLLCQVRLREFTELHDQRHLLTTQMRNIIKRGKFGSDHPFCTGWG